MSRRRAYIVTPVLQGKDAIGNDVLAMGRLLRRSGWETTLHAEVIDDTLRDQCQRIENRGRNLKFQPDDLLIFHHSIGCSWGQDLIERAKCHAVVRYHNVTPPEFFAPYSQAYVNACREGLANAAFFARMPHLRFLSASEFNQSELIAMGARPEHCHVVPPFHQIESTGRAPFHPPTLRRFKDGAANIIFVGGIKPNKGHAHAIRSFAEFHSERKRPARLIFVGPIDNRLEAYAELVREVARQCRVTEQVVITGRVSDSELRTYYMVADLFLCQSDHEGFCVPLAEAMYFRVPIVACGTSAVKDTVGEAGIVWSSQTAPLFAESISTCLDYPELCRELRWRGRERYDQEFSPTAISPRMERFLETVP